MADGYVDEIEDQGDETRPEERELSEDAQWKKIQKNTFTRWTNQHLKISGLQINDLQTDLSDGLKLVSLIEVLASHKFKQMNKRPTFRTQKLENVTKVLKFLEESEQLRIVNIDSSDIVDSRLKLILGLIWTLILHFSISMPLWEGEEPIAKDAKGKGPSPKHRILSWINSKMPDKPVKNLTTDWNDGTAIGALVDALAPGLCPDWTDWNPKDALKNAKEAMDLAEKWLDIAQLLKPDELVDPRLDEKAMMTYLSQFPRAKLKDGAPLRPKTNPARVRAYGPGLERTGNTIKAPARFVIDTFSAGSGKLEVLVLNPKGSTEPCTVEPKENQNQAYSCFYTPTMEGEYRVIIKYASKEITNSPFQVLVEGASGDPKKVTAAGPGIEKTGNVMGRKTFFNVMLNGAGRGNIECKVKDPHGREEIVKPLITKQTEENYLVEYTPILAGLHSVSVLFAGVPITLSPYPVEVTTDSGKRTGDDITPKSASQSHTAPKPHPLENHPIMQGNGVRPGGMAPDPTAPLKSSTDGISIKPPAATHEAAYVTGRGIQPKGLRVNEPTEFTVHTEKAGPGKVKVKIIGPGGVNENVRITSTTEVTHVCYYTPTKIGQYVIVVEYGQGQVQKSPFKVDVSGTSSSKVIAYGPGLKSGVVNVPAPFTVETLGSPGELGFNVEGPSEAKITCANNGDGSVAVQYLPTLPGEYSVHVLCNKEDIKGSPFMAQISDAPKTTPDLSKIKAFGPGLELNGVEVNKETNFTVDVKAAGAPLDLRCWCWDANGTEIPITTASKPDSTYYCTYVSKFVGKISVYISYDGVQIPNSPYKVNVSGGQDSSTVTAYGPGLESATFGKPAMFTVDAKCAGNDTGPIGVDIVSADGKKVPFQSRDKDGLREVQYTPSGTTQTTYTINITYKNQPIKNSPYKVPISAAGKAGPTGPAYATGRGIQPKGIRVNEEVEFIIHTEKTGVDTTPKVKVIGPGGVQETVKITKTSTVTFQCTYKPSKVGNYIITSDYGTSNVTNSPFKVEVSPIKVTKIKAYGPGLEKATVDIPAKFTVETNGESSQLGFAVNGPSEAKIECSDNGDGSVSVQYLPTLPGEYAVHVLANEEDIPKSPYMVMATEDTLPKIDGTKVKVFGPGVEPLGNMSGKTTSFTVDVKAIKDKKTVDAACIDQEGTNIPIQIIDKSDGTFTCSYTPLKPIKHTVYVSYGNQPAAQSPYKVSVGHGKSGSVKTSGPGIEKASIGQPTFFTIDTTEVGSQTTSLIIDLRSGKGQQVPFNSKIVKPGVVEVTYTPTDKETIEITITINYDGEPVTGSPFKVPVTGGTPGTSPGKVTVTGKGVLPTGVRATETVTFKVHTDTPTPKDTLKTRIIGPGGVPVNVQTKKVTNDVHECQYTAPKEGTYIINVDMNGKPAEKSPFKVDVSPFKDSVIKAYGPGLEGGVAGVKAPFIVNPHGSTSSLEFKVDGPSEAPITCKDNGDGTVGVEYLPKDKGEYVVHVLADKEEIPHSPFVVDIGPSPDNTTHPDKVKAYGPGLQTPGVTTQNATQFTIDCSQAGAEKPLVVKGYDTNGEDLPIVISAPTKRVSQCQYTPTKKGKHTISILYGGAPIANSPFTVNVGSGDLNSPVTAYGPGLQTAPINTPTSFIVDSSNVVGPKSDIKHSITDDNGRPVPTKVKDICPGKQEVTYTAPNKVPAVTINITHQGKPIEGSPFNVPVTDATKGISPAGVTVTGKGILPTGIQARETVAFKVVNAAPTPKDVVATKIIGPGGVPVNVQTKKVTNDVHECQYTAPKEGTYIINVDMNGKPAEKSPFKVDVSPFKDSVIKAYGPGLEGGVAGVKAPFIVNPRGSTSALEFKVEGPSEAAITCKDNGDGTVDVEYLPKDKGEYVVHVLADKEEIPHSPFVVDIGPSPDNTTHPDKVKAYGPGLQTPGVTTQNATQFTIDCSQAGAEKPLVVKGYDTNGEDLPIVISAPTKRVSQCQYTPTKKGKHTISILYGGAPIANSPFTVNVGSGDLNSPVTAYGPGLQTAPINTPTSFIVDSSNVVGPKSDIKHSITDDNGRPVPTKVKDICPGKQEVTYTAPNKVPAVTINITHQGKPIEGSPFNVPVTDATKGISPAGVTVTGKGILPTGIQARETVAFKVVNAAPTPKDVVATKIIGPGGVPVNVQTKKVTNDVHECQYTAPKEGTYIINVDMNGKPAEKSPFKVDVSPFKDSVIKAYGPGLEGGVAGVKAPFIVNPRGSTSALEFKVEGPSEAAITCKDNGDGTVDVEYLPKDKGEYVVHVLADKEEIPHSPFVVDIGPSPDNTTHPDKVKAYGPGLQTPGVTTQNATQFTIDCSQAGAEKPLVVKGYDTNGEDLPIVISAPTKRVSQCQYTPTKKGKHTISILYGGAPIANSPFTVNVGSGDLNSPVTAYGPGLQTAPINTPTSFIVDSSNVVGPKSDIKHSITDDNGRPVPTKVKDICPGKQEVTYTAPNKVPAVTINITHQGKPIEGSPFNVPVTDATKGISPAGVTVTGKGILPTGIQARETVAFKVVNAAPTPKDVVATKIIGPGGVPVNVQTKKVTNDVHECQYTAPKEGTYIINVDMNGKPAEKSPFKVDVSPFKDSVIKAYGPGLEGGVAGVKAPFIVNPRGSTSALEFKVEGPSEAAITCKDNGDGTVDVEYLPKDKGEYVVHVLADKEEIPHSPFVVDIGPSPDNTTHPDKVKAYGPGLQTPGVTPQKPTQFTIDCTQAGAEKPLVVKGYDTNGENVPINISVQQNKVTQCQYTPTKKGKHNISILYGGVPIANSPFAVNVDTGDLSSPVTAYGPGLQTAPVNTPTSFIIDSSNVVGPKGDIKHTITDEKGRPVPSKEKEVSPGKQEVTYTAPDNVPSVTVNVTHQGKPIGGSPFKVPITEAPKGGVTVTGKGVLPTGIQAKETVSFKVHTDSPTPRDVLATKLIGPGGVPVNVETKKMSNDSYECQYTAPKEGTYVISVEMNNKPAEKSPFTVNIVPYKESKIRAYGPGLDGGVAGVRAPFIVNTNGSLSPLEFKVEGPSEAPMTCNDNGDGTVGVEYLPKDKGEYVVHVLADKEEIPHSPFVVDIGPSPDNTTHPEDVKAYGPGLQSPGVLPQRATQFTVDSSQAGAEKPLAVKCYDTNGEDIPITMSTPVKRVLQCQYSPSNKGKHTISVLYGGAPIANSPFTVEVGDQRGDVSSPITVYGPGLQSAPVKTPTSFIVDSSNVVGPKEDIKCSIIDDKNRPIPVRSKEISPSKQEVAYTVPEAVGAVTINVTHQDKPIGGSPFHVPVITEPDKKVLVTGRGIEPQGLRVGEEVSLCVLSDSGVRNEDLKVKVIGPGGIQEKVAQVQVSPSKCQCDYTPTKIGPYSIVAEINGKPVEKSPFKVDIASPCQSPVKAFGTGLEHGEACKPATFIVETNGHTGNIDFKISGPGEAKISCGAIKDGRVKVQYVPEFPGEYVVRVLSDNQDITDSPFVVPITPSTDRTPDLAKARLSGPGLQPKGVKSNDVTNFAVDAKLCGPSEPLVTAECFNRDGKKVPVMHTKDSSGVDTFEYAPKEKGNHTVQVHVDNTEVEDSPFSIDVDSSMDNTEYAKGLENILTYGPGLQTADISSDKPSVLDRKSTRLNSSH